MSLRLRFVNKQKRPFLTFSTFRGSNIYVKPLKTKDISMLPKYDLKTIA